MHSIFEKKQSSNILIEQTIMKNYNQYYRLAYSYVHREADAFDIVQNGVCKALSNCQALKKPEFVQTWLYRIMLNECLRYVKQPHFFSYDAMQTEGSCELGYVEESYTDVDLQKALDALAPQDKAVIILRYFEDKKIQEIAEILEENVSTVKSRLYRSLKKLKNVLADDEECNNTDFQTKGGVSFHEKPILSDRR